MSTRHKPALLFALFVVSAVLCVIVAGCGQSTSGVTTGQTAEQTSGQTTEGSSSQTTGQTSGNVVTTKGNDSISISVGNSSWSLGEGVSIPEGFPTVLIPAGAKIVSAVSTGESGSPVLLVGFESATKSKSMYESFLDALPGAGYKIANKVFIDGGDEGSTIAIEANGPAGKVVITGGGKTGDIYTYTIMVQ